MGQVVVSELDKVIIVDVAGQGVELLDLIRVGVNGASVRQVVVLDLEGGDGSSQSEELHSY